MANQAPQNQDRPAATALCVVASLRGEASAHLLAIAHGLRRLGWRVVLAAPNDSPGQATRAHSACDAWEQIPLHAGSPFGHLRSLDEVISRHNPDIIHAHGIRAGVVARLWIISRRLFRRRKNRLPHLVYMIHGLPAAFALNPIRKWLALTTERILNHAAARVLVISESDRELVAKHKLAPSAKVVSVQPAIEPAPFRQPWSREHARATWEIPQEAFVIGTLAPLERQKAVHVLIDAAQRVCHLLRHVSVLIGGEGPLRADLEAQSEQSELSGTVRFLGEIADPTLLYRALDVFCLTSLWEGLPLVILEAAAVDVPIVATRIPGITDLLTNEKNALLVPPNDPAALAEALLRYQRDPAFAWKLASQATRDLEPFLRPEDMCRTMADLYAQVMTEKAPPDPTRKSSSSTPE